MWLKKIAENFSEEQSSGFYTDIKQDTIKNQDYRRVIFTAKNSQLVLMSLKPEEEIGSEIHDLDQFFRFEAGQGKVVVNGTTYNVSDGDAVVVPQGAKHNIINTSKTKDLKLYTVYSPPNHKRGTLHKTKAEEKEEPFNGNP